jgi:hypothetical protein
MPVGVPLLRNTGELGDVLTSAPVRGPTTWVDFAKLNNWTFGRGAMLVPFYAPLVTLTNGSEHVFAYRARPRYQAFQRKLVLRLRGAQAAECAVEFPSGGTPRTVRVAVEREDVANEIFTHDLSAQDSTDQELTFAITPNKTGVVVEGVGIWEVARAALEIGGSDHGTDPTRMASGQPIRRNSFEGAFEAMTTTSLIGRRVGLGAWAVPHSVAGATSTAFARPITSTSFVPVFPTGAPMLGRKLSRAATTSTVTMRALCWVSGGTGDIRAVSSVHGVGSTISIPAATPTWSTLTTFQVDAEDPTAADGRRANAWDMVTLEARKLVSGTLWIASVCFYEA